MSKAVVELFLDIICSKVRRKQLTAAKQCRGICLFFGGGERRKQRKHGILMLDFINL